MKAYRRALVQKPALPLDENLQSQENSLSHEDTKVGQLKRHSILDEYPHLTLMAKAGELDDMEFAWF